MMMIKLLEISTSVLSLLMYINFSIELLYRSNSGDLNVN